MSPAFVVVAPGSRTTVQDLGRHGYQRFGVPVSGALDPTALRAANLVVGNAPDTAALEISATGPVLEVAADSVRIAVAGEGMAIEVAAIGGAAWEGVGAVAVASLRSVTVPRGARVRVVAPKASAVGYLAVSGGFALAPVLGSRATYARAGLGGYRGRPLVAGDRLGVSLPQAPAGAERQGPPLDLSRPHRLRVLIAAGGEDFSEAALAAFLGATYAVTAAADRMGLRLAGPRIATRRTGEALSEGLAPGAIQIPGDGQPILLLADRQTTGGYPRVAHVIGADLPAAGRLGPGDAVRFEAVDFAAARAAAASLAADLGRFAAAIRVAGEGSIDAQSLASANLVSGVVSGDDDGEPG